MPIVTRNHLGDYLRFIQIQLGFKQNSSINDIFTGSSWSGYQQRIVFTEDGVVVFCWIQDFLKPQRLYLLKSTQSVGKRKEKAKQVVTVLHTLTLTSPLALDAPAVRGKDKPAAEICETNSKAPDIDPASRAQIPLEQKEEEEKVKEEHRSSFLHLFCFFRISVMLCPNFLIIRAE